ncbi:MAG: F0F1 ATP synthase subunit B' [Rhodospirillaceae bacterium]|jgi:F-type H+-transporting ATPase subunit b|nr:F0F1 ATP synthase subunit B' [Rhodospirillaceae bacterium]MBT6139812.1 F0F1 ATP synthase subunit B' [Rhodospirillaceae bacterium]
MTRITAWAKVLGVGVGIGVATATPVLVTPALASSEVGLPQLDFSTYPTQVFWLVVSFAILYLLMSQVAIPRISEVLEGRQERIANDLDKASKLRDESEQVRAEYEKALTAARGEAHEQLRQAAEKMATETADEEAKAGATVATKVNEAEARIEQARSEALTNVRSVAGEVAGDAVRKLIGVDVSEGDLDKAVGQAMEGQA